MSPGHFGWLYWQANMDIELVMDPDACMMYIIIMSPLAGRGWVASHLQLVRVTFCVLLVACVLSLLVLAKLSVLAKRLARKTPLRKPNRVEGSSAQSPSRKCLRFSWFSVLFHCFTMYLSCSPALRDTFHTSVVRYSLFVLKCR